MNKKQRDAAVRALSRAVEIAGGMRPLARLIEVDKTTVKNWFSREEVTPPDYCEKIEKATGVPRQHLRPDFGWEVKAD